MVESRVFMKKYSIFVQFGVEKWCQQISNNVAYKLPVQNIKKWGNLIIFFSKF